ncbi:hypothetical protein Jann_3007 [Jannaschia sp. CCS1]|nr:hypothetical protein Jann_3007 [Jannaschia sp. CCS1]
MTAGPSGSLTAPSRPGCLNLTPRRPSRDGTTVRHFGTPARRSSVILDHPPRGLLWCYTADNAAPWTAGGDIASSNRPYPNQSPSGPVCGDIRRQPEGCTQPSFAQAPSAAHRFIAKTPMQQCACCSQTDIGSPPILRSDLQGWRITCPFCGETYQDKTNRHCTPAFKSYGTTSRCGETLMNDHAEHGAETWFPAL